MRAPIVDVKRDSLDDGPGIRSVVFFKGCPLRCVWCQNPEAVSSRPELQVTAGRCVACGRCVDACGGGHARPAPDGIPRDGCEVCEACVDACPSGARRVVGDEVALDDLLARLARDEPFFRRSGGGVTLSGGEPTRHMAFAGALAAALSARGIHVLLETCGHFEWGAFERDLLPHLSAVYVDVKIMDPQAHRRHTGLDNRTIEENLERLSPAVAVYSDLVVLPRVPLVPGITDSDENLEAVAARLSVLGFDRVALLPYNPLWLAKARALHREPSYAHTEWMSPAEVARCRAPFEALGLHAV
jgi:pyruvate formate lyase activating enzyme